MTLHMRTLKNARHALSWSPTVWLLVAVFTISSSFAEQTFAQNSTRRYTSSLSFTEFAPGIEHGHVATGSSEEPLRINVLRVDLKRTRLKVVRALDQGLGLETVSSMATRHRAAAAINGGFFRLTGTYRGESTGLLMIDGKLISEPFNDRADVGFINEGPVTNVVFGHLKYQGDISVGGTRHSVNGVNRPLVADEMIVFTPEFHRTTLTNPDGVEVVVRRNTVVAVRDLTGSSRIPSDGFVISAAGKARDWIKRHVRRGSRLRFTWGIISIEPNDSDEWHRAYSILGAGPQLIKSGRISITHLQEKMAENFATDRHPRTAIGKTADGKLLMVTVDGRQPGISVGMSLYSLADLLFELNAIDAINLDGGGSTTMVVKQKVVNKPSDQTGERPVSDAILVSSRAK
jgi:exopolysaccharide biosynthesis protein